MPYRMFKCVVNKGAY